MKAAVDLLVTWPQSNRLSCISRGERHIVFPPQHTPPSDFNMWLCSCVKCVLALLDLTSGGCYVSGECSGPYSRTCNVRSHVFGVSFCSTPHALRLLQCLPFFPLFSTLLSHPFLSLSLSNSLSPFLSLYSLFSSHPFISRLFPLCAIPLWVQVQLDLVLVCSNRIITPRHHTASMCVWKQLWNATCAVCGVEGDVNIYWWGTDQSYSLSASLNHKLLQTVRMLLINLSWFITPCSLSLSASIPAHKHVMILKEHLSMSACPKRTGSPCAEPGKHCLFKCQKEYSTLVKALLWHTVHTQHAKNFLSRGH